MRRKWNLIMHSLIVVVLVLSASLPVWGERVFIPDKTGRWAMDSFNPKSPNILKYKLNADETAIFLRKYRELHDFFNQQPVLNSPKGFDLFAAYDADWNGSPKGVVGSGLRLKFRTFVSNEKTGYMAAEACPGMDIFINDSFNVSRGFQLWYNGLRDEQGRPIFYEPRKIRELGGYPVFSNSVWVIYDRSKPLWVPVSREQYLKALIRNYKEEHKADQNGGGDDNPYKAETQALYQAGLDQYQEELDSLSPEEQRSQAFCSSEQETLSHLVDPGDERGTPLVMCNPQYFDPSLPRAAVQMISIFFYGASEDFFNFERGKKDPLDFSKIHSTVRMAELTKTMDYQKLAGILDTQGK